VILDPIPVFVSGNNFFKKGHNSGTPGPSLTKKWHAYLLFIEIIVLHVSFR